MNNLGRHLLLEMMECDREVLNNKDVLRRHLVESAIEAGATPIQDAFHSFNPFGVSGFVVIAESHLSIHTWPEYGYAAVDVFTCGKLIDPTVAARSLVKRLKAKQVNLIEVKRGIIDINQKSIAHKTEVEDGSITKGLQKLQMAL